jgi:hypothetical protein
MTTKQTPAWLTDKAIVRQEALGRELMAFLRRRKRRKTADPQAKVDIGPRLRKMLADLAQRKTTKNDRAPR